MERKNRPTSIAMSPSLPQPSVKLNNDVVTASLPSGDSVQVYLYGATVTSWKTADGTERLFLSTAAALDGSKPIRGGIPIVFPVFGKPPSDHQTSQLAQHGFARNSNWEFMGSSTSENSNTKADDSVKLDFGLSSSMLTEDNRKKWPLEFSLVYSVTLSKDKLQVQLHVQNQGEKLIEFHVLFHSYFTVKDISQTTVSGLKDARYVDKMRDAKTFTEESDDIKVTEEMDRVYTTRTLSNIVVKEGGKPSFTTVRDSLLDTTVWNGWEAKLATMGDFEPKDGWKRYICIEPGTVSGWTRLEAGDAWTGGARFEVNS